MPINDVMFRAPEIPFSTAKIALDLAASGPVNDFLEIAKNAHKIEEFTNTVGAKRGTTFFDARGMTPTERRLGDPKTPFDAPNNPTEITACDELSCPVATAAMQAEINTLASPNTEISRTASGDVILPLDAEGRQHYNVLSPKSQNGSGKFEYFAKAVNEGKLVEYMDIVSDRYQGLLEHDIEERVARYYGTPTWLPTMVRFFFDLEFDAAYDHADPMNHVFKDASLPLQNLLNYLSYMTPEEWNDVRHGGYYSEFSDFSTFSLNEAKMMTYCYENVEIKALQAAQYITRDVARISAYRAAEGLAIKDIFANRHEANALWSSSVSDIAKSAAVEIMAISNGLDNCDQSSLRLLGITYEELNMLYSKEGVA